MFDAHHQIDSKIIKARPSVSFLIMEFSSKCGIRFLHQSLAPCWWQKHLQTMSFVVVPFRRNSRASTASLHNWSHRSLKGSSASSKASACFPFEIPAFAKQLATVSVVNHCIAFSVDSSMSGLSSLWSLSIFEFRQRLIVDLQWLNYTLVHRLKLWGWLYSWQKY